MWGRMKGKTISFIVEDGITPEGLHVNKLIKFPLDDILGDITKEKGRKNLLN